MNLRIYRSQYYVILRHFNDTSSANRRRRRRGVTKTGQTINVHNVTVIVNNEPLIT